MVKICGEIHSYCPLGKNKANHQKQHVKKAQAALKCKIGEKKEQGGQKWTIHTEGRSN